MKNDKEDVLINLYNLLNESKKLKDFIKNQDSVFNVDDEIKVKVKKPIYLSGCEKIIQRRTMKISRELLLEILTAIIFDTRKKLYLLENSEENK